MNVLVQSGDKLFFTISVLPSTVGFFPFSFVRRVTTANGSLVAIIPASFLRFSAQTDSSSFMDGEMTMRDERREDAR